MAITVNTNSNWTLCADCGTWPIAGRRIEGVTYCHTCAKRREAEVADGTGNGLICGTCGGRCTRMAPVIIRNGIVYHPECAPTVARRSQAAVARKGEDWWTAEEAENGWVPNDATWSERPDDDDLPF